MSCQPLIQNNNTFTYLVLWIHVSVNILMIICFKVKYIYLTDIMKYLLINVIGYLESHTT